MTLKYDLERSMETEYKYHYAPLPEPIPITEQEWPEDVLPLVHTRTMTFMHEKFIRECIDGILMQKTTFPVRVLIHEDASTDDTANIVSEYEKKYPRLIQAYYQTENSYSKKDARERRAPFHKWRIGKYEALCEGDDYWTDPLKLQKQVDYMEQNTDCSLCFHAAEHIYESLPEKNYIHRPKNIPKSGKFTIRDAILGGGGFMTTNSMLFLSKYVKDPPKWVVQAPAGDLALMLLLGAKGSIGYIDDVMSVYRKGIPGSWTSAMLDMQKRIRHYRKVAVMWDEFNRYTNRRYQFDIIVIKTKYIYHTRTRQLGNVLRKIRVIS